MAKTPEERKAYLRRWYLANREKVSADAKAFRLAHPEIGKARAKAKYLRHREKILATHKAKREANPERNKLRCKRYHAANLEAIKAQRKTFYRNNRERLLQINREMRRAGRIKDDLPRKLQLQKERRLRNPEKYRAVQRRRMELNINYRISRRLRQRVYSALRGKAKSATTMELLGCSLEHFKHYLQQRFTEGMHWNNHGKWHVDHIRPIAAFDLTNPDEQRRCFHFTNLQPLWASDNLKKHAKILTEREG